MGSIPESGRSPGAGHGNLFQYSCLENPMDRGAWRATVRGVSKSWTRLKRLSTHTHTQAKVMCTPCSSGSVGVLRVFLPQALVSLSAKQGLRMRFVGLKLCSQSSSILQERIRALVTPVLSVTQLGFIPKISFAELAHS